MLPSEYGKPAAEFLTWCLCHIHNSGKLFTLIKLFYINFSLYRAACSWSFCHEWKDFLSHFWRICRDRRWRKNITSNLWNNLGSSVHLARVLLGTCSRPIEGEYYYSTNKSRGHCRYSSWPPLPSSSLVPWQTTSVWKGSIPPGLGVKPSDSAIN